MLVNGEKLDFKELEFLELLKQRNLNPELIALELNGEVVPRSEFQTLILKENDQAQIVSFVGGG